MAKVKLLERDDLIALATKFYEQKIHIPDAPNLEYEPLHEGPCNCYDCLSERSHSCQSEFLLAEVYPKLKRIPRDYDITIGYNYSREDWIHEDDIRRCFMLLASRLNEIRVYNQSTRKAQGNKAKTWVYCYDCGRLHKGTTDSSFMIADEEISFCERCLPHYEVCCDKCNNPTQNHNIHTVYKSSELYHAAQDDMEIAQDDTSYYKVCGDCMPVWGAHICRYCSYRGPVEQFHEGDGTFGVCNCCHALYSAECIVCNRISYNIDRDEGPFVCDECTEERKVFHNHDYKPAVFNFMTAKTEGKRNPNRDLFFGFELEIESGTSWIRNRETMAALVVEKIGKQYIYCVHDGSLRQGIEIVTHPFTWEHYRTIGRTMWDEMLLFCRSYEWSADSYGDGARGPGFHIHTTKVAWGTYQLYKLLQLGYSEKNRAFFNTIAGRRPTRYCMINPEDFQMASDVAKDKKNKHPGHYAMINMNNKNGDISKTIEFRLFAGSLEPLIVHKNIEFVRVCYMFTRDFPLKSMKHEVLTRYIKANRKQYPHLCEYLNMKEI